MGNSRARVVGVAALVVNDTVDKGVALSVRVVDLELETLGLAFAAAALARRARALVENALLRVVTGSKVADVKPAQ